MVGDVLIEKVALAIYEALFDADNGVADCGPLISKRHAITAAIAAIEATRTPSPQVELRDALEKPAPTQDAAINPSWRAGFYQGYSQAKNDIRAALSPQDEVIGGTK